MIIKVSGMRDAENINAVAALGVDIIAFDFRKGSERFVSMVPSYAGIIPDYAGGEAVSLDNSPESGRAMLSGTFSDDMPQTIVTRIYNYNLHCVELCGSESSTMIENLRRTVVPDIRRELKVMKRVPLDEAESAAARYGHGGLADMLVVENRIGCLSDADCRCVVERLRGCGARMPFLVGGCVDERLLEHLLGARLNGFVGVDLNECCETAPGVKDVEKIKRLKAMLG